MRLEYRSVSLARLVFSPLGGAASSRVVLGFVLVRSVSYKSAISDADTVRPCVKSSVDPAALRMCAELFEAEASTSVSRHRKNPPMPSGGKDGIDC